MLRGTLSFAQSFTLLLMFSSSSDRRTQCNVMLELLKKFQSCRSHLSNTMQRAEQAIGDQASYMGKDNLQRTTSKVSAPTDQAYTVTVKYRCWMKEEHMDEYWIFVLFFHAGQRY